MPFIPATKQRTILTVFFLLCISISFSIAQETRSTLAEVTRWFGSESARPYIPYKEEILDLFRKAEKKGLPAHSVQDKLQHGAAKQVSPEILLEALRKTYRRMESATEILLPWETELKTKPKERDRGIKNLVIYLSSGLMEDHLLALSKTTKKTDRKLEDLYSISELSLQLMQITDLSQKNILAFSQEVLNSSLSREAWNAIPSLLLKAKAWNISSKDTVELFANILKNGGGILQMDREIQRRRKR